MASAICLFSLTDANGGYCRQGFGHVSAGIYEYPVLVQPPLRNLVVVVCGFTFGLHQFSPVCDVICVLLILPRADRLHVHPGTLVLVADVLLMRAMSALFLCVLFIGRFPKLKKKRQREIR